MPLPMTPLMTRATRVHRPRTRTNEGLSGAGLVITGSRAGGQTRNRPPICCVDPLSHIVAYHSLVDVVPDTDTFCRIDHMDSEVLLRFVLVAPPAGVAYGIQHGSGNRYESHGVQIGTGADIEFDFSMNVRDNRPDGTPNFTGPYAQGSPDSRFVYIGVGTHAGQTGTAWSRRMKVPLQGITWTQIHESHRLPNSRLTVHIPGTGKDGGPNCATVKFTKAWTVVSPAEAVQPSM